MKSIGFLFLLMIATVAVVFTALPLPLVAAPLPGVLAATVTVTPTPDPRDLAIVGGQPAEPGEWPWQVMVRPGDYLCGGSLIAADWVVTAAHCMFDDAGRQFAPAAVKVKLGEYDRTVSESGEQLLSVAEVIVHEQYDEWTNNNDIALLHLATSADFTDRVAPISLLTTDEEPSWAATGTLSTVTGWGTTVEGGAAAAVLMEVAVPIISNVQCNRSYGSITANMLCAGYEEGGKDSCQGDSGGPLVVSQDGEWRLAGIVSFGNGCARANYYGVYTRVARFVDWVTSHVGLAVAPTATPTGAPNFTPTATATTGVALTKTPTPQPTVMTTVTRTPSPVGTPTASPTESAAHFSTVLVPEEEITFHYADPGGGEISVTVPVGAVDAPVTLDFDVTTTALAASNKGQPAKRLFQLTVYQGALAKPTYRFREPLLVSVDYLDTDIKEFDESNLMLAVYDFATDSWTSSGLTLMSHDRSTNSLVVATTRVGLYALATPTRTLFLPVVQR
jgi:secreted trypsin-like serine protease